MTLCARSSGTPAQRENNDVSVPNRAAESWSQGPETRGRAIPRDRLLSLSDPRDKDSSLPTRLKSLFRPQLEPQPRSTPGVPEPDMHFDALGIEVLTILRD